MVETRLNLVDALIMLISLFQLVFRWPAIQYAECALIKGNHLSLTPEKSRKNNTGVRYRE